jgi:hypothetical protein
MKEKLMGSGARLTHPTELKPSPYVFAADGRLVILKLITE